MQSWKGDQSNFLMLSNPDGYTEVVYLELKKQIAKHYIDMVFLYFGHAPTLPQQLEHKPNPSYVSEV